MTTATSSPPLLGLAIPILQAPIGSTAGIELATAVSEAGGLGALALTWMSPADAGTWVRELRRRTTHPFQVNFVLAFEPKALPAALEAGAPVVTFSWGMPREQVELVRSFGASLGIQVSTRDGARQALDLGADFLICQGVEAGGHVQATQDLWKTLPAVCAEAGAVPVVAAGGLALGRDIALALRAGAAGAMFGTRFVATAESLAHAAYKQRLVEARHEDATLTLCFDLGWPYAAHRVLRNRTLEEWEAAGCPPSGNRPGEGEVVATQPGGETIRRYADTPALVGMTGTLDELCLYAGTGCGEIAELPPAGSLVKRLWDECRAFLRRDD